jgi:hypothetical protein
MSVPLHRLPVSSRVMTTDGSFGQGSESPLMIGSEMFPVRSSGFGEAQAPSRASRQQNPFTGENFIAPPALAWVSTRELARPCTSSLPLKRERAARPAPSV